MLGKIPNNCFQHLLLSCFIEEVGGQKQRYLSTIMITIKNRAGMGKVQLAPKPQLPTASSSITPSLSRHPMPSNCGVPRALSQYQLGHGRHNLIKVFFIYDGIAITCYISVKRNEAYCIYNKIKHKNFNT